MKLLVHTCCAPCATYSIEKLQQDNHDVTVFFYNPNIQPLEEYKQRRDELIIFAKKMNYSLIIKDESSEHWMERVKGFENEPEGGLRCAECFKIRLEETAKYATDNGFEGFTTVLTISPHKNSKIINEIGKELEKKHKVIFLEENFKKNDGFKKSVELSRQHKMYRQTYCGCTYSLKRS